MNTASALGHDGRARWSLRLFGGFELSALPGGDRVASLGKRERVLLAYLALNPKGREQRRKLTTLLWGDSADETTLENLRNCLYGLRKALGDSEHRAIASDGEEIVLDAGAFAVDVLAFRRLAAQSGPAELEEAAKLYSGGLLEGLDIESEEFESWRRSEATRCRDLAVDVLNRLMMQLSESGETERALEAGQRLLALDPLHEAAVRRLMRLHAESGRRSTAIQLYRTLADALKAELDAQPEAETRTVFEEITRGDERTPPPVAAAKPPPSLSLARPSDATLEPLPPPATRLAAAGAVLRQAATGRRNWILAGGLAAAIVLVLAYQFIPRTGATTAQQPAGVEAANTVSSPAGAISIAVLPFVNLSGDASQEFFSDGMTEEITTALAKIPDLRVVARSSAFQFKGERKDIRSVGDALGVTHLIEGSVRKEGDRVRITAQLIEANSGTHLWTENYDREFTDIFAIQEDIAEAIAKALRVPLGSKPGNILVNNRNIDAESYQQYLRAKTLMRTRGQARIISAAALLEQVVARNPEYAPAWALLGLAYHLQPNSSPERTTGSLDEFRTVVNRLQPKAEAAGRRAVELDPNLADGHIVLADVQGVRGNLLQSLETVQSKVLVLDPNNPEALHGYALGLSLVGHAKEALPVRQRLLELEPAGPNFVVRTALVLWLVGQNDAAIAMLRDLPPDRSGQLARIYASMGRYNEAIDVLEKLPSGTYPPETVKEAVRLLRTAPTKVASPESLPPLGSLGWVYLYVGAPDRVLEVYDRGVAARYLAGAGDPDSLWHPSYAPVRKTERFKAFARNAGMVEYWRAKGWPELCRPTGADDFVCD